MAIQYPRGKIMVKHTLPLTDSQVEYWAERLADDSDNGAAQCDLCGSNAEHNHTLDEYGFPEQTDNDDTYPYPTDFGYDPAPVVDWFSDTED